VFRSRELRDEAMHGEAAVFFRVDGRDMWGQHYRPPY